MVFGVIDQAEAGLEAAIKADPAVLKYYDPENCNAQEVAREL